MSDVLRPTWRDKTPAEIVHELVCIRGDLVDQSGRDALARIIEWRLAEAERRGAERGWDEGWRFGTGMFAIQEPLANPYRAGDDQ